MCFLFLLQLNGNFIASFGSSGIHISKICKNLRIQNPLIPITTGNTFFSSRSRFHSITLLSALRLSQISRISHLSKTFNRVRFANNLHSTGVRTARLCFRVLTAFAWLASDLIVTNWQQSSSTTIAPTPSKPKPSPGKYPMLSSTEAITPVAATTTTSRSSKSTKSSPWPASLSLSAFHQLERVSLERKARKAIYVVEQWVIKNNFIRDRNWLGSDWTTRTSCDETSGSSSSHYV